MHTHEGPGSSCCHYFQLVYTETVTGLSGGRAPQTAGKLLRVSASFSFVRAERSLRPPGKVCARTPTATY